VCSRTRKRLTGQWRDSREEISTEGRRRETRENKREATRGKRTKWLTSRSAAGRRHSRGRKREREILPPPHLRCEFELEGVARDPRSPRHRVREMESGPNSSSSSVVGRRRPSLIERTYISVLLSSSAFDKRGRQGYSAGEVAGGRVRTKGHMINGAVSQLPQNGPVLPFLCKRTRKIDRAAMQMRPTHIFRRVKRPTNGPEWGAPSGGGSQGRAHCFDAGNLLASFSKAAAHTLELLSQTPQLFKSAAHAHCSVFSFSFSSS